MKSKEGSCRELLESFKGTVKFYEEYYESQNFEGIETCVLCKREDADYISKQLEGQQIDNDFCVSVLAIGIQSKSECEFVPIIFEIKRK